MINKPKLKEAALNLRNVLHRHGEHVSGLQNALASLIEEAIQEKIEKPYDWRYVPGGRFFTEGKGREFEGLEDAYATFKIQITGMDLHF